MTRRIIEISEQPAHLSVRLEQLKLTHEHEEFASIPMEELAMVIVANPRCSYSHAALVGLASHNVSLVACDDKFLPTALLLPINGHTLHAERVSLQVAVPLPRRKRLWQDIVRQKIRAQAAVLDRLGVDSAPLRALLSKVRSGDPSNVEARAARLYWQRLFPGGAFRRDVEADDQNVLLNYGYAVLRALVARAIVGAGLHPSLGLHHHNRYDTFSLAADLMEPFRPIVDERVSKIVKVGGSPAELTQDTKAKLIGIAHAPIQLQDGAHELIDALRHIAASLVEVQAGQRESLLWPKAW